MVVRRHAYTVTVEWTGNTGAGTASYTGYERAHLISAAGKPAIAGSSDPVFCGDSQRWNPEELLVASLSACHKLWFLGLCAQAGIVVTCYVDTAEGFMAEQSDGGGQFVSVTLRPHVVIAVGPDIAQVEAVHQQAHARCFIARSVNFPVELAATTMFA